MADELYQEPNLDVQQMQADFAMQQTAFIPQGTYGDQQAMMTGYRASYGDIPAMLMAGARTTGNAFMGAAQGAGTMLSAVGSMVMPATYAPPARVVTGYYGQYQQHTGIMSSLAAMAGISAPPRGSSAYLHGYYGAADIGERIGGGMVGAATVGTGLAAGYGAGAVGGMIGGTLGAAFGPLGMVAGSAVGTLAGNIAGYMGVDAVGEMVAQRRQMNAFLESSSFRYVGAGSPMADPRLGAGMSFSARRETTDFMKAMDIKDPTMNMDDMFNILQGATNSGLMTGTRTMDDFKRKFKDVVEGVKVITKTLNTTLEEGLQVMKDFKAIGVDPSQMATIGMQAGAIGKVTGRTAQEVVGLGLQGAELYRGTGIEMKIGYQANVMNLASIRSARDAGIISQEAIVQAGGEEAMAQRMTGSGLQFMQSAVGRGFGAAFFNPAAGPAGFNQQGFMQNIMGGGADTGALAAQAVMNLSSPEKVIQYTVNQDKFMSEMGKTFGGRGAQMGQIATAVGGAKFYQQAMKLDFETALKYSFMADQGMSAQQAQELVGVAKNAGQEFQDRLKGLQAMQIQRTVDEAYGARGLHYQWERAKDWAEGKFVEPIVRGYDAFIDRMKEGSIERYESGILGARRYDLTNINYRAFEDPEGRMPTPTRALDTRLGALKDVNISATVGWGKPRDEMLQPSVKKVMAGIQEGKITGNTSTSQLVEFVTGKPIDKVSAEEYSSAVESVRGLSKTVQFQRTGDKGAELFGPVIPMLDPKTGKAYGGDSGSVKITSQVGDVLTSLNENIKADTGAVPLAVDLVLPDKAKVNLDASGGLLYNVANVVSKAFTYGLAGASAGAVAGSPFAGVGAVPGAIVGGLVGAGYGVWKGVWDEGSWTGTQGAQVLDALDKLKGSDISGVIKKRTDADPVRPSEIVVGTNLDGSFKVIDRSDYKKISEGRKDALMTVAEATELHKAGKTAPTKVSIVEAVGKLPTGFNANQLAEELYGKKITDLTHGERAGLIVAAQESDDAKKALAEEAGGVRVLRELSGAAGVHTMANLQDRLASVGSQLFKALDLESTGKGDAGVLSLATEARFARTGEERRAKVDEATRAYLSAAKMPLTKENISKVRTSLEKYSGGVGADGKPLLASGAYSNVEEEADKIGFAMRSEQTRSGGEFYLSMAKEQLSKVTFDKNDLLLDAERRSAVESKLSTVLAGGTEGVKALLALDPKTKEERADLRSTTVGQRVLAMRETILELQKTGADLEGKTEDEKKEARKKLETRLSRIDYLDPTVRKKVVDDVVDNKGAKVAGDLLSSFSMSGANDQGFTSKVTPAGSGAEASGTYQGTAEEITKQQVSINLEVLEALRALTSSMKGGR